MRIEALNHITGHSMAIYDVVYRNEKIYTTSADKFAVRWNLVSAKQEGFTVKLNESGFRIALNNDNHLLIGNAKGGIHFIDLEKKSEVRYLTQHQAPVFGLTFNSFKNEFYSGDADGFFAVWDASTMDLKLTIPLSCGKIRCIALNENGEYIAVCGHDGIVRIFETNFFNEIHTFRAHKDGVNCAVFNGAYLFTGGKDAHINKWDWKEEKQLLTIPAHNYAVYDLILLHDNDVLVSGSFDKTVKLFYTKDLSIIKRLEAKDKGHKHTVNRLAKINNEEFLSVSDDRVIIHWKANKD
jgi:WD40 repeat protein